MTYIGLICGCAENHNKPALSRPTPDWVRASIAQLRYNQGFDEAPDTSYYSSEVYRLWFFPSFESRAVIRIYKSADGYSIASRSVSQTAINAMSRCVSDSPTPDSCPAPATEKTYDRRLSTAEAQQFLALVHAYDLWNAPTKLECHGLDGARFELQVFQAGTTVAQDKEKDISRWSPGPGPFSDIVRYMFMIGNMDEYLHDNLSAAVNPCDDGR